MTGYEPAAWREVCPDLAIRSTFIVGFPGEEDFQMLLDWLDEAKIDRADAYDLYGSAV